MSHPNPRTITVPVTVSGVVNDWARTGVRVASTANTGSGVNGISNGSPAIDATGSITAPASIRDRVSVRRGA